MQGFSQGDRTEFTVPITQQRSRMASSRPAKKLIEPALVPDDEMLDAFGAESMLAPSAKLTDLAYEKLEEAIVTLKLRPGTSVSESSLSKATGIGRTPVREAIQRLAREQLIHILPQRGLLIPAIDVSKQLRLLETRREIERLVCRSAAKRATVSERERFARLAAAFSAAGEANDDVSFIRLDREFNELCLAAAHNEFSEGAMRLVHGLSRRFWYFHYRQAADLPEIARLHAAVASAIALGDVAAAAAACDELLDNIEAFTRSTVMTAI
jgi:DNA-binding GntR family transcriptional regulator